MTARPAPSSWWPTRRDLADFALMVVSIGLIVLAWCAADGGMP